MEAWRSLGINRVSLGVQSFVEAELRRTGRKHSAEGVEHDVELLRSCGIEEINIDLIADCRRRRQRVGCESLCWVERLASSTRLDLHA